MSVLVLAASRRFFIEVCGLLTSCEMQAQERADSGAVSWRLSCSEACGLLVPRPGIEPAYPILEGEFSTTGPPEKSHAWTFCLHRGDIQDVPRQKRSQCCSYPPIKNKIKLKKIQNQEKERSCTKAGLCCPFQDLSLTLLPQICGPHAWSPHPLIWTVCWAFMACLSSSCLSAGLDYKPFIMPQSLVLGVICSFLLPWCLCFLRIVGYLSSALVFIHLLHLPAPDPLWSRASNTDLQIASQPLSGGQQRVNVCWMNAWVNKWQINEHCQVPRPYTWFPMAPSHLRQSSKCINPWKKLEPGGHYFE